MARKLLLLFLCAHLGTALLSAQESFSAGIGVQANDYSTNLMGFGVLAQADFRFNELISLGTTFVFATDLGNSAREILPPLNVFELSVNVRWYFLRFKSLVDWYFLWQNYLHWFVQFEGGFAVLNAGDKSMTSSWSGIPFMAGIMAGVRIMLENVYVEPYLRFGEPYLWAVGLTVGLRITGRE